MTLDEIKAELEKKYADNVEHGTLTDKAMRAEVRILTKLADIAMFQESQQQPEQD